MKPDTPVVLPKRQIRERRIHNKKPTRSEDIIEQLQHRLRNLRRCTIVLAALLLMVTALLTLQLFKQWKQAEMGSNYSTITSTEATTQTKD